MHLIHPTDERTATVYEWHVGIKLHIGLIQLLESTVYSTGHFSDQTLQCI